MLILSPIEYHLHTTKNPIDNLIFSKDRFPLGSMRVFIMIEFYLSFISSSFIALFCRLNKF